MSILEASANNHNSNKISSQNGSQYPFRVVLLEKGAKMQELWLPSVKEGRFSFMSESKAMLTIRGEGERWIAECDESAWFDDIDAGVCNSIVISHNSAVEFNTEFHRYILYSEAEDVESNTFIPYYIEKSEHIVIGRMEDCDICCSSDIISRYHAELSWKKDGWHIVDLNSTNGVYVNGAAIADQKINVGDFIYIMGLRIVLGVGYIAMNSGNNRAKITSPLLRRIQTVNDIIFSSCPQKQDDAFFSRLPRHRYVLEPSDIEIEGPPPSMSEKMPLLLKLGSPVMSGGMSILSGNVMGAMTSMLMPLLTQGFTEKDRREYEAKRKEKYTEYLEHIEEAILAEKKRELKVLTSNYPSILETLAFATNQSRLWERAKTDADFLSVRIGTGEIPMAARKNYQKEKFKLENDELEQKMFAIGNRKEVIADAPVMVSLQHDFVTSIIGYDTIANDLLRNIALQITMTHSYDEVKLVLLMDEESDSMLGEYAPYLPHFWNDERTVRYIARSREDAQQLSKYLNAVWETYSVEDSKRNQVLKTKPAFVVLAQSKKLYDSIELFKDIESRETYSNFSIITCFKNPPKECTQLVNMSNVLKITDLRHPEKEDIIFNLDPFDESAAHLMLHRVMNTHLPMSAEGYELPKMITFLDMYQAATVEHLNPLRRWQESNPIKSLAAPVGVGTDGKIFTLDLHEKKQGPHGLVAGSTGSGKSEFIITYLLSMAVNYSPDEVAFVLIDYKGGGLADAFVDKKRGIHLPHVVGTITNLDGSGISRSLASINSELKRRQALFSRAKSETGEGTMDIYDYQRLFRQKRVSEPLPHLFIVSDEFAELKKQQPEFMDELISTARIGRSLGVHLILATQKPSGVVNDQIWSNTKFRVCLKVADKGDSYEMLKRYEAAELKNTGRFYLQVGFNELFALGQSAWCGAGYEPNANQKDEVPDFTIQFLDNTGQTVYSAQPPKVKRSASTKQIVAIVQYLSELSKRENIIPRGLWKEPLPKKLDYFSVNNLTGEPENGHISALIGMVDDPEHQAQFPGWIDMQSFHNMMICAPGGTGKSTFIRTMLYSLSSRYSPEEVNYYILDLSGGAQSLYKKTPHCGAYLGANDEGAFGRLLALMREMALERRHAFEEAEVTSYDAYLQAGENDKWSTMKRLPLALVVIDSYQNISTAFSGGDKIFATFNTFMAEVSPYGIHVIVSVSHSNEVSTRTKQEIDYRVVLNPADKYAASEVLNARPNSIPPALPGRGMMVVDDRPLEFHVATFYSDKSEQVAVQAMRADMEKLCEKYPCGSVRKLPALSSGQTYGEFVAGVNKGRVPLGYHIKDMKPLMLPLKQFTSMAIYFGNQTGIRPILNNIITAASINDMELWVLRRAEDSCFGSQNNILKGTNVANSLFYCNETDVEEITKRLNDTVTDRNKYVSEFCLQNGIPAEEKGKAKKAIDYVSARTTPVLILFESFADFANVKKSDFANAVWNAFLGTALKGYNIYFIGCFYPEDYALCRSNSLIARLLTSDLFLMFGGKFHQQGLVSSLPTEYRKREKPEVNYDIGLLRYRENLYEIQMPCGEIEMPDEDSDDASIV